MNRQKTAQLLKQLSNQIDTLIKHGSHNQQTHGHGGGGGLPKPSGDAKKEPFDYPADASSAKGKAILKAAGQSGKRSKAGFSVISKRSIDDAGSRAMKKGFEYKYEKPDLGGRVTRVFAKGKEGVSITGLPGGTKCTVSPVLQGTITKPGGTYEHTIP